MRAAVHAEWTKLRTVPSTGWLLLATVGLTVASGALATWSAVEDADLVRLSLVGVYGGQLAVVALATLAVTAEYDTGTMRTTLLADPRRTEVAAAKAAVVTVVVLATALLGVLGSLLAARPFVPLSIEDGSTLRAYGGTVLYFGLVALLSFGVGTAVRHTAGALSTVLALLFVFPILAQLVTDERTRELILKYSPMTAGLAIQSTRRLGDLPIGPWAGLGVLAAYAGAALLLGTVLFRLRDA